MAWLQRPNLDVGVAGRLTQLRRSAVIAAQEVLHWGLRVVCWRRFDETGDERPVQSAGVEGGVSLALRLELLSRGSVRASTSGPMAAAAGAAPTFGGLCPALTHTSASDDSTTTGGLPDLVSGAPLSFSAKMRDRQASIVAHGAPKAVCRSKGATKLQLSGQFR